VGGPANNVLIHPFCMVFLFFLAYLSEERQQVCVYVYLEHQMNLSQKKPTGSTLTAAESGYFLTYSRCSSGVDEVQVGAPISLHGAGEIQLVVTSFYFLLSLGFTE